jgi:hypothetical protein
VIFAISASAFVCAFRSRPGLLAILVVICGAHVFLFSSSILDRANLSTIADPRFLSVLSAIPCLHLTCLLLTRSPATPVEIALALSQSIIPAFAVWIRRPRFGLSWRCRCSRSASTPLNCRSGVSRCAICGVLESYLPCGLGTRSGRRSPCIRNFTAKHLPGYSASRRALRPICPLGASGLAVRRHNEIIELQLRRRACLGETDDRRLFARSVPLLTAAFFVSLLPVFPAPDIQIVADQYFMLLIVLGSWIVLALCVGVGPCIYLRRARRALAAAADSPAVTGQFALLSGQFALIRHRLYGQWPAPM